MSRLAVSPLPLVLREVEVASVTDLTPRLRRITVTGSQLSAFRLTTGSTTGQTATVGPGAESIELPGFSTPGFDDHVKCIFTSDVGGSDLPTQLPHGIEWPPSALRVARDYTPTRFDPETGELDLEFVLHGHGPAASWARGAEPGHTLHIVGPKMTTALPPDLDWILLAGDETALPAITRFARERPNSAHAIFVIVVEDESAKLPIDDAAGGEVRWIVGDPTDGAALRAAVEEALPDSGTGYAWAAGESRALLPLRRLFKASPALDRSAINVTGYWTHTDDADAADTADAGADAPSSAGVRLPRPPVAWLAIRTALQFGIPAALADGPLPVAALAARVDVDRHRLRLLLDALTHSRVLSFSGAEDSPDEVTVALAPLGEELVDDEHMAETFLGHHADEALALLSLGDSLRSADTTAPWERHHGASLYRTALRRPEVFEELAESSEGLAFFASAVAADPVVAGADRLLLTGPGAVTLAEVLATEERQASPEITEEPEFLDALRGFAGAPNRLNFVVRRQLPEPGPGTTVVSALALGLRTDAEARAYLSSLRECASRLVVIERFAQDALNPNAPEAALTEFALTGRAVIDADVVASLAGEAWTLHREFELGWGVRAVVLCAAG